MKLNHRLAPVSVAALPIVLLLGCASTTTATFHPSAPAPVCAPAQTALVLWAPRWRSDQKDVPEREKAAAAGLQRFLDQSGCFAGADLRRVEALTPAAVRTQLDAAPGRYAKLVGIELQELGPVVKLLASAALIEGGTEVVLRVVEFARPSVAEQRQFTVRWHSGGPGVVKGVASLPDDVQAALGAGLQPGAASR